MSRARLHWFWRAAIAVVVGIASGVGCYAAIVVVFFVVGYSLRRDVLSGLLLGAVALFLPTVYIRMRQTRRLQAFNSQLPDVLDHLIGSLRAGYGLVQAIEWVGRQIPNPAGMEFDRVVREVQLGLNVREAL